MRNLIQNVTSLKHRLPENIYDWKARRRLENKDFTLVSNNCWGSKVYQDLKLKYNTPFIGLFLFAPCYITLLEDFTKIYEELEFTKTSKYNIKNFNYPIALMDDVEVHFMHYKTEKEAELKWMKRVKRINSENIFFQFSDRDLCTYNHLKRFNSLPYANKVCFTAKRYPELKSTIYLEEFGGEPYIGNIYQYSYIVKRHFDVVDWLNCNK